LSKNVWKSFIGEHTNTKSGTILTKTLNKNQIIEHDLIKKLSLKLIFDNYNRTPLFQYARKTSIGYNIVRCCWLKKKTVCSWLIKININTNEAILSCNKECQHKNPNKNKGLF
jgi:hypothetical protein